MTGEKEDAVTRDAVNVLTFMHVFAWCAWGYLTLVMEKAQGTQYEPTVRTAIAAVEQLMDQVEADATTAGVELRRPEPFW